MFKDLYIDIRKFFIVAILLKVVLINLSWYSYFAVIFSLYQFSLVFFTINDLIPIRNLFSSLMCLQMLVGPVLAYNGLDVYQTEFYKMQVSESEYFTYALPAVICFVVGVFVYSSKRTGERPDAEKIAQVVDRNPLLPYILIVIGFVSSLLSIFFGKEFAFVFVLLSGFKFIGLFLMILGRKQIRPLYLALVYGSIISSSIIAGMFHDLVTWLLFLLFVYAYSLKPSNILKASVLLVFVGMVVVIQQLKGDYREATWKRGEEANVETFTKSYETGRQTSSAFTSESMAKSNIRINQGYIITNIMTTVPSRVPFENGQELVKILEAAFLPRIIAPDKLNAGDRDIFMKYSGIFLTEGTSMALSSAGDGYINFGIVGGCVFMFFLGLFFNLVLMFLQHVSLKYPLMLAFTPLIFYYPVRPDCELQTILGHLIKSIFLVLVSFYAWKRVFQYRPAPK